MPDQLSISSTQLDVSVRLATVRQRIERAASESRRTGADISLVAVTKTHSAETVRYAHAAGLWDFGESYVQEAIPKIESLADVSRVNWHFIGHLQSNKSNLVTGKFSLIQGVDSLKLGQRIAAAALEQSITQNVLVQIKLGGEATKSGIAPELVLPLCEQLGQIEGIRVLGLMAIAPLAADGYLVKEPRPFFAEAKAMFDRLPTFQQKILSMGMSGDFEVAIEEGSTMVRIGTTLFGSRGTRI